MLVSGIISRMHTDQNCSMAACPDWLLQQTLSILTAIFKVDLG